MKISRLKKRDINGVIKIASQSFSGLKERKKAKKWIECNFSAYPRMQYFIAKDKLQIVGYILWMEKGGFRKESVFELEQVATAESCRGKGIGTQLINKSIKEIKKYLKKRGSFLKAAEVTTGTENKAQGLYRKTLGAEPECIIKNLFRGDEVVMVARFKK